MKSLLEIIRGNGEVAPEEIVQKIVEFEKRIPEYQAEVEAAEKEAQELHKTKVCGGSVSTADLEKAARKVELTRRDLAGAEATFEDLDKKLDEALKLKKEKDLAQLQDQKEELKKQRVKLEEEYKQAYIKAKVLQAKIHGVGETIEEPLNLDSRFSKEIKNAVQAALGDDPQNTWYYADRRCEGRIKELEALNLNAVRAELFTEARNG